MDKNKEVPESIRGIKKNPKEMYAGLVFFWIFCLIPILIIISIISDEEFSRWTIFMLIIPVFLLGFGIWGILFTIRKIIYNKKLYEHLQNWTILEGKAIITKFKHFSTPSTETQMSREWYIIEAKIWGHKLKSEKIDILIFWINGKDIDKKFYEKLGIPYSPKDPKYNNQYKERREIKKKEINAKLSEIKQEYVDASWIKKIFLTRKINKLNNELTLTAPISIPYKGKSYYIGDEITVLVDPDNPKNYIM